MARRGGSLRLNPARVGTFWIAVLLVFIGVIAETAPIASLAAYALWIAVAGFVLLALGNLYEGL